MTAPPAPAPLPPWEETAREVADWDRRYWDSGSDQEEE